MPKTKQTKQNKQKNPPKKQIKHKMQKKHDFLTATQTNVLLLICWLLKLHDDVWHVVKYHSLKATREVVKVEWSWSILTDYFLSNIK